MELARYYATRGRLIDVDEVISVMDDEGEEMFSETALTQACMDRHMDIVKGLLAAGADCNKSNNSKITPLMMALVMVARMRSMCSWRLGPTWTKRARSPCPVPLRMAKWRQRSPVEGGGGHRQSVQKVLFRSTMQQNMALLR